MRLAFQSVKVKTLYWKQKHQKRDTKRRVNSAAKSKVLCNKLLTKPSGEHVQQVSNKIKGLNQISNFLVFLY